MQKDKKFADFIKVCFRMKSNFIVINRVTLRSLEDMLGLDTGQWLGNGHLFK